MPDDRLDRTREAYQKPDAFRERSRLWAEVLRQQNVWRNASSPPPIICSTCGTLNNRDDAICVKCLAILYTQEQGRCNSQG